MGLDSRRLFAPTVSAFADPLGRVTKSAPGGRTTPPAVLTYPVRDLQGDVVEPSGLDLWEFENRFERLSNFEHGPYIGTTRVEFKSMPRLDASGRPDESLGLIALPVGETTFFGSMSDAKNHTLRKFDAAGNVVGAYDPAECWQLSDHLRPLVPGVYDGVSLEFRPAGPEGVAYKSLGKSPMLNRDAYHFIKSHMIGLASACKIPVNQFAGYSPASAETIEKAEKALKYCEKPGSLDVIRKSLSPLVGILKNTPSGRVTAPVRRDPMSAKTATRRVNKAEEYDDPMTDPTAEVEADGVGEEVPEPVGDEMTATAAAAVNGAQGLLDLCAMIRDGMAKGEHVKGRKQLASLCDDIEKLAAKAKAVGDMVQADVGGGGEAEAEMPEEPPMPETDETGGIVDKSFGSFRPRRFVKASPYTLKQIKSAKAAGGGDTVKELERHLEWALAKIDELEKQR